MRASLPPPVRPIWEGERSPGQSARVELSPHIGPNSTPALAVPSGNTPESS
jgi:hypothetical protein